MGEIKTNKLYGIKRLPLGIESKFDLSLEMQEAGTHDLTVFAYCDSYAGCETVKPSCLSIQLNSIFILKPKQDVKFTVEVLEENNEIDEEEPSKEKSQPQKAPLASPPVPASAKKQGNPPPPPSRGPEISRQHQPPTPDEQHLHESKKPQPPRPSDHGERRQPPRPPLPPAPPVPPAPEMASGGDSNRMEVENEGQEEEAINLSKKKGDGKK